VTALTTGHNGSHAETIRLGIFSTLTGPGSRALVTAISRACSDGSLEGAAIEFMMVDRALGESDVTDASVAAIGAAFEFPIIRESALRFRASDRKVARAAQAAGDPGPLNRWRDDFNATYREKLPPTDIDLLLGDMWIWGPAMCAERRGLNLHPALPSGPLGGIWYEAVWDLIEADARESGVMLHRVSPEVDRGAVVTYARYGLRTGEVGRLWGTLPATADARHDYIRRQRAMKREATTPLFKALRLEGLAREVPLLIETVRAVADGRIKLPHPGEPGGDVGVVDALGIPLFEGLDLTEEVEADVARTRGRSS
jgi:folate-dependent phosphoribosylglycinamide formyltransferase PurN